MGFSPTDWPQLPRESQDSGESSGPEWETLRARLDAAHSVRVTGDDAAKAGRNGSFSPGSAESIGSLGEETAEDSHSALGGGVNQGKRGVNHRVSTNGKPQVSDGAEEAGTALPGHTRD